MVDPSRRSYGRNYFASSSWTTNSRCARGSGRRALDRERNEKHVTLLLLDARSIVVLKLTRRVFAIRLASWQDLLTSELSREPVLLGAPAPSLKGQLTRGNVASCQPPESFIVPNLRHTL